MSYLKKKKEDRKIKGGFFEVEIENFCEIKAIDEARAKKIIKWYESSGYQIAYAGGFTQCLTSSELIQLLMILGNSKNIERDIIKHANKLSRPYIDWIEGRKELREEGKKEKKISS